MYVTGVCKICNKKVSFDIGNLTINQAKDAMKKWT